MAKGLEGLRRQDGIHAAAVVITKEPLTDYLPDPAQARGRAGPEDAPIVTQYEMHGVEELGLLKMDFLGLRNLDVITDTLELIQRPPAASTSTSTTSPLDDDATLELLLPGRLDRRVPARGRADARAHAVAGADHASRTSPPSSPCTGPGPMAANMHNDYADRKNGRKPVEYFHPDAEELLADTYGLMIYQESDDAGGAEVRRLLAGRGRQPPQGHAARRSARSWPRSEKAFVDGCETTGYGAALGTTLFDIIEQFADYAFNKSHAFGYGFIAYQTAYLKAHYPVEYLAALLTSVKANLDKAAVYLAECRTMGIEVARARRQPVGVRLRARRSRPADDGREVHRSSSGCRPCATSARASSTCSSPSARPTGPSPTSTTSATGSTSRCSTSGPSSR